MKNHYKIIALCAMCSILAVACGPKKEEQKPMEKHVEKQKAHPAKKA